MAWLKVFCVAVCLLIIPSQVLANIGTVVAVKPGAEITRDGNRQPLKMGMEVASGDAISTDRSGVVQLIFVDETKIAIGPNASMVLDVKMLRGNRKAKSFAVQALGGSFRFISGKSRKRAYSVRTPTATMAVRGTIFDIWIAPGNQSSMLVLQGTVQMCGLNGGCRSTGRQCSLYATSQRGRVGRPIDQEQYDKAIQSGFPFIQAQERLLVPLRVNIEGCAREAAPVRPEKPDGPERREARAREPEPSRPSRPEPDPTPDPPSTTDPGTPGPEGGGGESSPAALSGAGQGNPTGQPERESE